MTMVGKSSRTRLRTCFDSQCADQGMPAASEVRRHQRRQVGEVLLKRLAAAHSMAHVVEQRQHEVQDA